MMKRFWSLLAFLTTLALCSLPNVAQAALVKSLSYTSTNVTTSAYVTLDASTPISVSKLLICDTSGQFLKIATGAAGSEIDIIAFGVDPIVSGCIIVPEYIAAGTRLSIKAISGTANSGFNTLSYLQ